MKPLANCPTVVAIVTVALLSACGCRSRSAPPPAGPAESPGQLARRAADALRRRHFVQAGELYEQALAAWADTPSGIANEAGDDPVQWRCQAALARWLGGQPERADALLSADRIGPTEAAAGGGEYLAALRAAMACYRSAGWPSDDPDRLVDVLTMAPALQACRQAEASVAAATAISRSAPVRWAQLNRLADRLTAWTAMDQGRLDCGAYETVAAVVIWPIGPARVPADPPRPVATSRPERDRPNLAYRFADAWIVQPPPVPGNWADLTDEWLGLLAGGGGLLDQAGGQWSWRLIVAIRQGHRIVGLWWCEPVAGAGPTQWSVAGGEAVLSGPDPATARLAEAVELAGSAAESGAVRLSDRVRAETLAQTVRHFAGSACPVQVVPQGDWWWVVPVSRPGKVAPDPDQGDPIAVAAGWLAYRDWPDPKDLCPPPAGDEPIENPPGPLVTTQPE